MRALITTLILVNVALSITAAVAAKRAAPTCHQAMTWRI